jgi:ribosome-binding ATPase YchF (GTP1/OBG family)
MKLSLGIVGLPNVGKSTLFKVLTKQPVLIANYPFATIDPNVGVVAVPDERLDKLAELSRSAKKIPAVVEFLDIAGLVKGASRGEGLGNQFLSHIRECQAILVVLRVFRDADVSHVEETIDPSRDLDIITTELLLKDLDTVEKRLGSLEREAKSGDKKSAKNLELMREIQADLKKGLSLKRFLNEEVLQELQLISAKRRLILFNGEEGDVPKELFSRVREEEGDYLACNVALADEIPRLIEKSYAILGLISFFTTGEDETRAWTVRQGAKAPQAAGVIHSDFEEKFIRAEVVGWKELLAAGSWQLAKQKGLLRLEGKEYVVQDGDVLEIRHG